MKTHLTVIQSNVVKNTTCFAEHERCHKTCKKETCRHWFKNDTFHNCVVLAANDGPKTLQDIGDMFELTRMRICQIERNSRETIRRIMLDQ